MSDFDKTLLTFKPCPAIDLELDRIRSALLATTIWKNEDENENEDEVLIPSQPYENYEDDLAFFIMTPITGELEEVPGVSSPELDCLNLAGVYNTYQLIARYLDEKRLSERMEEHHTRFLNYLCNTGITPQTSRLIMQSIGEKVSTMIPGLYDPSIFAE